MWPFVEQSVAQRTSENKNRGDPVTKVMFLCAIARPRYNAAGNCTFDEKLECGRLWNSLLLREQVRIKIEVNL